jgi:chemotaxis family two-component system response regulator Rcp1
MTAPTSNRPLALLLVEDNPGDIRLTQEAFRDSPLPLHLHVVTDGELAMRFLRRQPPYEDAPQPDLILLDLNLPKKDGREVLEDLKADHALNQIPVAVLTTSDAEEDILQAYHLHANCYIRKPLDIDRFLEVIQSISDFWFGTVTLPPRG